MTRRISRLAVPALVLLPAFPTLIGGWAVVVVEDLPEYAVAGQPLTLIFTVRQHGFRRVEGLKPRVEAVGGREQRTHVAASVGSHSSRYSIARAFSRTLSGRYTAAVTLPRPGEWIITIHSDFGRSRTTLMPLTAIAPGSPPPPILSEAERGRRLFAAKGCVTCHVGMQVGPDLFSKRYTREYVTQVLADPERVFAGRQGGPRMPNLNLNRRESAALTAYLISNNGVAAR
jgi:hypothetical protein